VFEKIIDFFLQQMVTPAFLLMEARPFRPQSSAPGSMVPPALDAPGKMTQSKPRELSPAAP